MYGCESWTIKKAECRRIDAFELWCWRRLLRVPWTARRSNQSILKEINPEYSLEGLMLKLKFQYFGHLMRRTDSLEKTLMLGKIWRWEKGTIEVEMFGWLHQFDGHEFEQALGVGEDGVFVVHVSCWALVRKSNVEDEIVEKGASSLYSTPNLCKALHFHLYSTSLHLCTFPAKLWYLWKQT